MNSELLMSLSLANQAEIAMVTVSPVVTVMVMYW